MNLPAFLTGNPADDANIIATPHGERPVETLSPGDLVLTAANRAWRIVWLGRRRLHLSAHPRPQDVMPVRVSAGAFAPKVPARDLCLSPDHAVFIDGVLIPIRYLVNGRTILQEPRDDVTYHHIELEQHDIILAEGLPCETYLDTGNRGAFANGGPSLDLHPDFARRVWETRSCAPLVLHGPPLEAARSWLLQRAASLGYRTTSDPDLHLLVGETRIDPTINGRTHRFQVPPTAQTLRLVSRSAVPAEVRDNSPDHRKLGVAVSSIIIDSEELSLNDPALTSGWHAAESNGPDSFFRWTDGAASLPCPGCRMLAIEVAMTERYWLAETAAAEPEGNTRAA